MRSYNATSYQLQSEITQSGSTTMVDTGGFGTHITAVADANYTALVSDSIIAVTSLTATRTITLPSTAKTGQWVHVKDQSGNASGTNKITLVVAGGALIDNASSVSIITARGTLTLYFDGTNYNIF